MLKKVRRLNYDTDYSYAPPAETALVQTNDITAITSIETRRNERCCRIRFRDGSTMDVCGVPEDFIDTSGDGTEGRQ